VTAVRHAVARPTAARPHSAVASMAMARRASLHEAEQGAEGSGEGAAAANTARPPGIGGPARSAGCGPVGAR